MFSICSNTLLSFYNNAVVWKLQVSDLNLSIIFSTLETLRIFKIIFSVFRCCCTMYKYVFLCFLPLYSVRLLNWNHVSFFHETFMTGISWVMFCVSFCSLFSSFRDFYQIEISISGISPWNFYLPFYRFRTRVGHVQVHKSLFHSF